jgi:hypothetical protein
MVRTYKRKTTRGASQDVLERASDEVLNNGLHLRPVADAYGVDKMTLYRYCKKKGQLAADGTVETQVKCGYARPRELFSDAEESDFVTYLLDASKMFFGLSPKETKKLAYELAVHLGKEIPNNWQVNLSAGNDWFSGFMSRNSSLLSIRKPEATSLGRITSFNRTNVNLFYDNLDDLYRRFHFEPQAIWNVDETVLTTAQNPGKILAPKGVKQVGAVTSAERGTLVTLCCAVNALGHAIPPMFIFPRVRYHERLVDDGPPGCIASCHKSGWMTKENFLVFLQHFVKHAKPSMTQPVILLLDNHESHISVENIQFAKDHGVHLLSFPTHCSHRLQPLDCSVYFPLKRYYNAQCDIWCNDHPGRPMQALDIPTVCAQAFKLAMTPANIQSGFEVTGIYPFNRNRISDDAFLPSSVTDRPDPSNRPIAEPTSLTEGESSSVPTTPIVGLSSGPADADLAVIAPAPSDAEPHASTSQMVGLVLCSPERTSRPSTPSHTASRPTPSSRPTTSDPEPSTSGVTPSSLYAIRPLPKAGPRNEKRSGRKRGRTRILTDTPEKIMIEQENAQRGLTKKSRHRPNTDLESNTELAKNDVRDKKRKTRQNKKAAKSAATAQTEKSKKQKSRRRKTTYDPDSEEEEETFCLICTEAYSNSKSRERWVQCISCEMWAHEACTDGSASFVCQNCDSCDDM